MSLQDVKVRSEYRSLIDDIVREFYIPLLSEATTYKRAVGFFSSTALSAVSRGIAGLVRNGGTIELIASPILSDEDIAAIRRGYEMRDGIVRDAVLRQMREPVNEFEEARLNLLAHLISDGVLDIKIAFIENSRMIGIYHEKMGIIADDFGNAVAFSGSNNESAAAMLANYETIDVYCSWKGDADRVKAKADAFSSLWSDQEPHLRVVEFPELKDEIIGRYRRAEPRYDIDSLEFGVSLYGRGGISERPRGITVPSDVSLHQYQLDAIAEWKRQSYCGVFDMATGTGKTYTCLGAITELCRTLDHKLAVFIVAPFKHLVEQWVEDLDRFNVRPIVGYSSSPQKDWKKRLEEAVRDQKLRVRDREFFCFVCTNATFASNFVQTQVGKLGSNALIVVDEAHNFGAESLGRALSSRFKYRLALSATIERHRDEEGTQRLFDYFGNRCICYTLEQAISENKLTPYKYYPVVVTLNESERRRYAELTYELSKCVLVDKDGRTRLSERGKRIAMERARLVAGAEQKLSMLEELMAPYVESRHILVYCGATRVFGLGGDFDDIDEADIRQIDAVTDILGNRLGMRVSQFTSRESSEERQVLKREFAKGDTLQVLIAIRCLDEGVNIPNIRTAFILASTTNPKEYIQRRGRVLRLAPGKKLAEIYDFLTLPRPLEEVPSLTEDQLRRELTLVKNELHRGKEFARLAINMVEAESVLDEIMDAYRIGDSAITFEEDYQYGHD